MHAFGMHKLRTNRRAQIPFWGSHHLKKQTKKKNHVVINVSCMAENRTYHVIVAQFLCEIKKPLSVILTLKLPHMINFVFVDTI